jgi:heme/copper-type cytochrome/quinol oxidase subunit 2
MSKTSKIITGILSVLPLLLMAGYLVMFFSFFFKMFTMSFPNPSAPPDPEAFMTPFIGMFAMLFLMVLVTLAMLIYFIIHINNNKKLDNNEKLIWILIIIFVGMIGKPIYWYMKIWKEDEVDIVK